MRLSIVVINYNYERFVAQAVESALSQSGVDEVVVVDDGSTDESIARLATYADRIKLVRQANEGHVAAFQRGFEECSGDAIIFLDADDLLYPGCVSEVKRAWGGDDVAKVQFRLDTIDAEGVDQDMPFPFFGTDLTPEAVRRRSFRHGIYPWTVSSGNAYSRSYLGKILPINKKRFPRSPDGYANKLAPLYGSVVSISKLLGAYRVHGRNAWAQGRRALDPKTINDTVRLDLELDAEFRRRAGVLGLPIAQRRDLYTPQHLEYRILGKKLDGKQYPVPGESLLALTARIVVGLTRQETLSVSARCLWIVWIILFSALPKPIASWLYLHLRSQTGRSPFAKSIVRLSR
jgi:glycosyltransferase involved in cell wall biosynthesis